MTWKEVYVLAYGGLRGAIGICFALIVAQDRFYSQQLRDIVLFDMAGNAILTLLINGSTTGSLVSYLGLCVKTSVQERVYLMFIQNLCFEIENKIDDLKKDKSGVLINWEQIEKMSGLEEYRELIKKLTVQVENQEQEDSMMRRLKNKSKVILNLMISRNQLLADRVRKRREEQLESGSPKNHDESRESRQLPRQPSLEYQDLSIDIESDSSDNIEWEELVVECRNKFLLALKGHYFLLKEENQMTAGSFLLLMETVNWDLDNQHERMNSWEFLMGYLHNPLYMHALFKLKAIPIIGNYISGVLFNQLSEIYDVVSNYIVAHEKTEEIAQGFPIDQKQVLKFIINESRDNRNSGEDYIKNYLNVSFPEIQERVQTRKAS